MRSARPSSADRWGRWGRSYSGGGYTEFSAVSYQSLLCFGTCLLRANGLVHLTIRRTFSPYIDKALETNKDFSMSEIFSGPKGSHERSRSKVKGSVLFSCLNFQSRPFWQHLQRKRYCHEESGTLEQVLSPLGGKSKKT
jgi:hypothetical protein